MTSSDSPPTSRLVLVVGIALVALSLRISLASVGPIVESLRTGTGLPSSAIGFLTTLPLIAFGVLSVFASRLAERVGLERAVAAGLVLIAVGTALRAVPGVGPLYLGTALYGVGVAIGNVLLPAFAKRSFPDEAGPITGLYSGMMGVGAALAAGLSVPIAATIGWRATLGAWAIPVVIAFFVWLPQLRGSSMRRVQKRGPPLRALLRSPTAWQVAVFMGLQSASFYVLLAWLPALLQSRGLSEASAGGLMAMSQITGIVGSAIVPVWAGKVDDQRPIVGVLTVLEAIALVGLLLPGGRWAALWVGILGAVLSGTFALALTFLVVRSPDAPTTGSLSGMAQSIGYALAAGTPPLFGALHDLQGTWSVLAIGLLVILGGKTTAGFLAGRPHRITIDSAATA